MPAIQPELLKRQTAQIISRFEDPERFVRALHDHLDWYTDRARRSGLNSPLPPILHTYRVPARVMRELLHQLAPAAAQDPAAALNLADALWAEENLECRRLAIHLLSWAPVDPVRPVEERLQRWMDPHLEDELLEEMLANGTRRYRLEATDRFLRLSKEWMTAADIPTQSLGLRLLTGLVRDPGFTNLPVIYMRVRSLIQRAPPDLQPDLTELISALALRSPTETAHYLLECLKGARGPGTASLVRGSLDSFPPELQRQLRTELVGAS